MNDALSRPFYAEYAWAFDLLIDRPVKKECGVIAVWLARHGFGNIQYFGAYNHSVEPGATDRLVVVAQLSDDAD